MRLTQRLFLLVLIALLPALAIQAYNEFDLRRTRQAEVDEMALRQAQLASSELNQIFEGIHNLLIAVAEVPSVRSFAAEECAAYLATLQPKVPYLKTIAAIDMEGRVVCRQSPAPPELRLTDRSYFREALESGVFLVGDYTESRISGRAVLPMAMPLQNPDGKTIGVLAAALDLGWLGDQLRERALPKNGSLTVADRNGVIIAREPLPERFVGTRIPDDFMHLVNAPEPGTMSVVSQDGTRRVLGYMPVGITPKNIYVSAGVSTDQEFAAIDRATQRGFALILAGLVLALSAAWAAGRYFISQPVMQLMGTVESVAEGRLLRPHLGPHRQRGVRNTGRRLRPHGGGSRRPAGRTRPRRRERCATASSACARSTRRWRSVSPPPWPNGSGAKPHSGSPSGCRRSDSSPAASPTTSTIS